jgi:hypothetical protein
MPVRWKLPGLLQERGLTWDDLPIDPGAGWRGETPPLDATLADLIAVCRALGCQPGDLLAIEDDDPAAEVERNLASDLFYQSFLAHRAEQDEDED